jgi:hypothetical protein
MGRRIVKYRIGPGPDFTYLWLPDTEPAPAGANAIIDEQKDSSSEIRHHSGSNGHYWVEGIAFDAPGGAGTVTRKNIYVVPDLTRGVDLMGATLYGDLTKSGDRLLDGQVLIGQVAAVIAADAAAKTVTLRGPIGILRSGSSGGRLDEGYYVSFGVETFVEANQLAEYMVKRVGAPVPVGDNANEDVVLTLDAYPGSPPVPGTAANLAVRFIRSPIELTGGEPIEIGKETFTGSPIPGGRVIRVSYERNQAGAVRVRGHLTVLY